MGFTPATSRQVPEHAILDVFNKQTYLGNSFIYSTNVQTLTTASTEYPLILLSNPSTNGLGNSVPSVGLFQGVRKWIQANNFDTSTVFNLYLNPTTSAGTAKTPENLRPANANTSKMTVKLKPTVSDSGTFVAAFAVNYQEIDSSVMFVLDPGYSMLVTATPGGDGTIVIAELSWYEL